MKKCEYKDILPSGLPIIVTGSTGGIGHEIVRAVALLGHPMILPCRNKKKFDALADAIKKKFPKSDCITFPSTSMIHSQSKPLSAG